MSHALTQTPAPKQAEALTNGRTKVNTYEFTGGQTTKKFAQHNLSLIPAIPTGSVIHDNCTGSGIVSRLVLEQQPDVKIYATDIDQPFLDVLSEDAAKNSWPIETSNQRSEKTSFDSEFFDYDITNIGVIFWTGGGADGVKEVYRTLKPGGTALINCWRNITWLLPILMVRKEFRGDPPIPNTSVSWADGQQLKKVILEAGFKEEKLRVESQEVQSVVPEGQFRDWVEKAWAYLGGIGGWHKVDAEKWDEEVDRLAEVLKQQPGTTIEDGNVCMKVGQWIAVVEK
jgi:SAM-dependent methyltransferase